MWRNIVQPSGHRWQYGECVLHARYLRLQTQTQNIQHILLFYGNNGCTNAPKCNVYTYIASLVIVAFAYSVYCLEYFVLSNFCSTRVQITALPFFTLLVAGLGLPSTGLNTSLSHQIPWGTKRNHETRNLVEPLFLPRFEPVPPKCNKELYLHCHTHVVGRCKYMFCKSEGELILSVEFLASVFNP